MKCEKCGALIHGQQKICDKCKNPIADKTGDTIDLTTKKSKKKVYIPIAIVCLVILISAIVGISVLISSNSTTNKLGGYWDTLGISTDLDRHDYKEVPDNYTYVEIEIQDNGGVMRYWDKGMLQKQKENAIDGVGVSYFKFGDGNTLLVEKPRPNSITGAEKKDLFSGMYQYSESAKSGKKGTWYLDGDTLFLNGKTLHRI